MGLVRANKDFFASEAIDKVLIRDYARIFIDLGQTITPRSIPLTDAGEK